MNTCIYLSIYMKLFHDNNISLNDTKINKLYLGLLLLSFHFQSFESVRSIVVVVVVVLLFYVHGKHLWSCRDGQLT